MAADDSSTHKCCTKCRAVKPRSEFSRRKASKDGLYPQCKACKSADGKQWYERNREKKQAKRKAWLLENRDSVREYHAAYYQANRAKRDAATFAWYKAHPEVKREQASREHERDRPRRLAAMRLWRERNREYVSGWRREYRKKNPELLKALRWNYKARRRAAEGRHSGDDIKRLFVLQKGRCACCRASIAKGYHIDHVQPLSKGGSNDWLNLQLLCPACNLRKKDKDPFAFAKENWRLI